MAATVPVELGGLGVSSLRDYIAGINQIARGGGSTALAANMHVNHVRGLTRARRGAKLAGDNSRADALAAWLREVAAGRLVIAAVGSETGSPHHRPPAEARRDGDGWRLNSRKAYATGTPLASLLAVVFQSGTDRGERSAMRKAVRDQKGH
jgi:alkylation response protein AidB-like acyl-CoA dehydrogenase